MIIGMTERKWTSMFRWLKPPSLANELQQMAYTSLHYTLLVSIVLALLILIPAPNMTYFLNGSFGLSFMLVCLFLLRRYKLYAAGLLYLSGTWLTVTIGIYSLNGINNILLFLYIIINIYANIIFVERLIVWGFIGASTLSITVLAVGQYQGILPLQETEPIFYDRLIIAATIFSASSILISLSTRYLRQSIQRLQEHDQVLQNHNLELKELTEQLRNSQARYQLLFDNTASLALVYDSLGHVVLHNELAARLLGTLDLDWAKATVHDIFATKTATQMMDACSTVLKTGTPIVFEGQMHLKNGTFLEHLTQIIPLPHAVSDLSMHPQILALTTDLTAKNEAERRKADLQTAHEKLAFFTEFFSIVSHDIKTPLTVIKNSLYLLRLDQESSAREQRIGQIENQADILDHYVQDMLVLSRLDRAPNVHKEDVDLCALVDQIIERLRPKIERKNMQVAVAKKTPKLWTQLDHDQIQRALLNIFENAVNYTPENGSVQISLDHNESTVEIAIQDSGIGIPAEDLPHIFQPFYRSSVAQNTVASGSGLGLAIVEKIINLHEGQIHVSSDGQHGTLFQVNLPYRTKYKNA